MKESTQGKNKSLLKKRGKKIKRKTNVFCDGIVINSIKRQYIKNIKKHLFKNFT